MLSVSYIIHCFFKLLYILNTDLSTDYVGKSDWFKSNTLLTNYFIFKWLLLIVTNRNRIDTNPHRKVINNHSIFFLINCYDASLNSGVQG